MRDHVKLRLLHYQGFYLEFGTNTADTPIEVIIPVATPSGTTIGLEGDGNNILLRSVDTSGAVLAYTAAVGTYGAVAPASNTPYGTGGAGYPDRTDSFNIQAVDTSGAFVPGNLVG